MAHLRLRHSNATGWGGYSYGVMTSSEAGRNHAVLMVGHGYDSNSGYAHIDSRARGHPHTPSPQLRLLENPKLLGLVVGRGVCLLAICFLVSNEARKVSLCAWKQLGAKSLLAS